MKRRPDGQWALASAAALAYAAYARAPLAPAPVQLARPSEARKLQALVGERFLAGLVLCSTRHILLLARNIWALPIEAL